LSLFGTKNQTGQALIELLVILPVFGLFMVCVLPMTAYGIFPTWLDERLALIQLMEKREQIPDILSEAHGQSLTPVYPDEDSIEETTMDRKAGHISLPLPGVRSDRIRRIELRMPITRNGLLSGGVMASRPDTGETVTRSLSLLTPHRFEEPDISRHVKNRSLLGVLKGKDTVFRKLGVDLFHFNLDAVPAGIEEGGKNGTQ
jgi:hypothetical protein